MEIYYNGDRKLIQRPLILVPSGSPRALAQNTNAQALPADPAKSASPWLELDLFCKSLPGDPCSAILPASSDWLWNQSSRWVMEASSSPSSVASPAKTRPSIPALQVGCEAWKWRMPNTCAPRCSINGRHGASLVAQWLRTCLLMQGTRVRALVWEDPTRRRAAGPVSHNY